MAGWNSPKGAKEGNWSPWVLGVLLAAAIILAYSNSLHGPFQYDDFNDIRDNATIRHLWPLRDVFFMSGRGFTTRPVVNLSFALNYAMGGLNPFPYHLTNLGIHLCTSLVLLGVLRRSFALPSLKDRFSGHIPTLSLVTAALWALHPLLTESVSYITQRYESLMGLFVLLTFYGTIRMAGSPSPTRWGVLASASCLLALGSKEVAVSVPILVLLFDRTYMAGSFRGAWRERWGLYLGLLVAWACFAFIQSRPVARSFAGFGLDMPWWRYAINQPLVILHYLRLAIWPHPLNFDYFWPVAKTWQALVPGLVAVGSLLGFTLWASIRIPKVAFLLIFFFFILAPTSSVMPILDLAVEHRMYLPLVPVIVVLVFTIHQAIIRLKFRHSWMDLVKKNIVIGSIACVLAAFGALTYLRNEDYQNSIDIWRDAVEKSPNNPRAHHNYAYNLAEAGYNDEALKQYAIALQQAPNVPIFLSNYGVLLGKLGRYSEALPYLRLAVQLEPNDYKHIVNLGAVLWQKGSLDNAIECFHEAVRVNPQAALPYSALTILMLEKNEPSLAHEYILKALRIEPQNPGFQFRLGLVLLRLGDYPGARTTFESAIRLDLHPENMASDMGWAFHDYGMDEEAVSALRQALHLRPEHIRSQIRLAWILATSPDATVRNGGEALSLAAQVIKTQPVRSPEELDLLAVSLAETGRFPEAEAALQQALAQSKSGDEKWVPEMENRLALFQKRLPYRSVPLRTDISHSTR